MSDSLAALILLFPCFGVISIMLWCIYDTLADILEELQNEDEEESK